MTQIEEQGSDQPILSDAIAPAPAAVQTPAPRPARGGGFFAGLLGGVLAGAAGFGALHYMPELMPNTADQSLVSQMATQAEEIAALQAQIGALTDRPDTGALQDRIAQLEAKAGDATDLAPMAERLNQLESRIAAISAIPADGTGASPAALAALQAEVQALKLTGGPAAAVQDITKAAEARLAEIEARAAALEGESQTIVQKAQARAAAGQLAAALDSGAPFAGLVADLGEVPPPLADLAASGAPTLVALRDSYPDAARAALEAALRADMGATWSERVGSFLRTQTGVRSLQPREGDDPDAILSRAEEALAQGDLAAALTQLDALPDPAKQAMAPWRATAEARLAALAALPGLLARIDG